MKLRDAGIQVVRSMTFLLVLSASSASAMHGDCGQPVSNGATPAPQDALHVLRASLKMAPCDERVCDVTADCRVTASDSLRLLTAAVGMDVALLCGARCGPIPCGAAAAPTCAGACPDGSECAPFNPLPMARTGEVDDASDDEWDRRDGPSRRHDDADSDDANGDSDGDSDGRGDAGAGDVAECTCVDAGPFGPTTTLPWTPGSTTTTQPFPVDTSTTTTTMPDPVPTTVPPTPTTTTTTTTVPNLSAGQALYDGGCSSCHSLGSYDRDGFAPNLSRRGGKLRTDMTGITGSHRSIPEPPGPTLSNQELQALMDFLNAN